MDDGAIIGDAETAAAILAHIREHIGEVDSVFHELESPGLGVDIHHVPPTKQRDCHTLVTTGMSDRLMPEGSGVAFGELVMSLPPDWPMDEDSLEAGDSAWPLRMLKTLGRLPHERKIGYDFGLCVDAAGLPLALAGDAGFGGVLLAPPVTTPDEFWCLDAGNGKVIDFFGVVLLYPDELELVRKDGIVPLAHKLDSLGVTELMQPGRKHAV